MRIGGFQKVSLIDYPGRVSCVIFTQGCNFRCPYCHNRELVDSAHFQESIPDDQIMEFLGRRVNKLQGVVVTGGEPTLQPDLKDFLIKVKQLGFDVKLDTNGSHPEVLETLLDCGLLDFVAMDIKAPFSRYQEVAGTAVDVSALRRSMDMILQSGLEHVFRTTVVKPFLKEADLASIVEGLDPRANFILQEFIPTDKLLDSSLLDTGHYTAEEFAGMKESLGRTLTTPG